MMKSKIIHEIKIQILFLHFFCGEQGQTIRFFFTFQLSETFELECKWSISWDVTMVVK